MKILIKIFVIISSISLCAILNAQKESLTNKNKEKINQQFEEHFKELNLSDQQKSKYIQISKKYGLQIKSLKNSSQSKFNKYRKIKGIKNSKDKDMKALLNHEQYNLYKANKIRKNKTNFNLSTF